jgi:molecular chaperone DnaK
MVLDWGGGTFDISILNLKSNSIIEAAVFGEKIGGDDIDVELAKRIHAEIVKKSGLEVRVSFDDMNPADRDIMIARCEQAKIAISDTDEEHDLTVSNYGEYGTKSLAVSVELFNGIIEPIIKGRILRVIDAALGRANITPAGVDAVIIVGGSSNLTPYETAITHLFGEDKIIIPHDRKRQWSAAEGASLMQIIGGNFKLNDSLGVLLSDGSIFPLLKADADGAGTAIAPISFSLVEDSQNAHFVFTNGSGNIIFERTNIPTKGFLNENILLKAEIRDDLIAAIEIQNASMGNPENNPPRRIEINKLTFHYDISGLN